MRWDALFADLEAQMDSAQSAAFEAAVVEATRLELSRLELADRLRAHRSQHLTLWLPGRQRLELRLGTVGSDWLSGVWSPRSFLLPLSSVLAIDGLQRAAARTEPSATRRRLGIAAPLRTLARSRVEVSVQGAEGLLAQGLIAAVGRDFIEVSRTPRERSGAAGSGPAERLTIPLHAVVWVHGEGAAGD